MAKELRPRPKTAKIFSFIVFLAMECLGLIHIITQHVHIRPGKYSNGHSFEIYGRQAIIYGIGLMILGAMPMLLFAKTPNQAILIGTISGILGVGIMIFSAYL